MLVDFGLAVDLEVAAGSAADALDVRLQGSAANKDMECVAMREDVSWSFDADTFGICASIHVLLWGKHMEIVQDTSTKRWMPRETIRRYWQRDLWTELFDTLLNLDEASETAIGSRPESLRDLRKKLESYVEPRSGELESQLRYQSRMLPNE